MFGASIAARMLQHFARAATAAPFPQLTEREHEVLRLVATGMDNPAVARRLGVSGKTVRNHVSAIITKLQVSDRTAAVLKAREAGLTTSGPTDRRATTSGSRARTSSSVGRCPRQPADPEEPADGASDPPTGKARRAFAWSAGSSACSRVRSLIGFFALDSSGVRLAASRWAISTTSRGGPVRDLRAGGRALGRWLPATRTVRVATVVAWSPRSPTSSSACCSSRALTFEQQIGPVMVTILAVYGWLLTVNLVAHRTRTLPRAVTRTGVLAVSPLTALVLIGAGYVLPGIVGQLVTWLGYGLGVVGWLGLPLYVLLLALRVFPRPHHPPAPRRPNGSRSSIMTDETLPEPRSRRPARRPLGAALPRHGHRRLVDIGAHLHAHRRHLDPRRAVVHRHRR